MTTLVQFPGLGLEFEINRVAFTLFGVPIYWYGVLIGLGVLLAIAFALSQAPRFGLDADRMIDVIVIGLVCGVIGARVYFVIFDTTLEYNTFFDLINLRGGGLAIYGGVIFGFLGALLGCKLRKVPVLPMFDLTAMGFLVGQCLGRWGNFFNQEAFGNNTALPFGMLSPATTAYLAANQAVLAAEGVTVYPAQPVHPTFLYESLWCALGFLLLFCYRKKRKFNGEIALFYIMWYGLGRFFIEGLRTDSLMVGPLRVSQVVAAASVLAAFCIWLAARLRTAGKPLAVPTPPPRTARVKLAGEDGPTTVVISWPAGQKAPTKEERVKLAREQLAGEAADEKGKDAGNANSTKSTVDAPSEAGIEAQSKATAKEEEEK